MQKLICFFLLGCSLFAQSSMDYQLNGSRLPTWSVDSGSANAYVLTTIGYLTPNSSAGLRTGSCFDFLAANANTTASTANVDAVGVKTIKRADGTTGLSSGDITGLTRICYDGTNFRLNSGVGGGGGGGSVAWNNITDPTGAMALTMGANTSTFTYNSATGAANNLWLLQDGSGNTGNGYMFVINEQGNSAMQGLWVASSNTIFDFHNNAHTCDWTLNEYNGTTSGTYFANNNCSSGVFWDINTGSNQPSFSLSRGGSTYFSMWSTGNGIPTGAVTTFAGAPTTNLGIPAEYGNADFVTQTANVTTQTVLSGSPFSMKARISCYTVVTTAASSSSTLPTCVLGWTDKDTNVATTATMPVNCFPNQTNNTAGTTTCSSEIFVYVHTGSNVTWATTGYASTGGTAMQYAAHVVVEGL